MYIYIECIYMVYVYNYKNMWMIINLVLRIIYTNVKCTREWTVYNSLTTDATLYSCNYTCSENSMVIRDAHWFFQRPVHIIYYLLIFQSKLFNTVYYIFDIINKLIVEINQRTMEDYLYNSFNISISAALKKSSNILWSMSNILNYNIIFEFTIIIAYCSD